MCAITDHDIDDRNEFTHTGSDRDFEWFMLGQETQVEGFDNRVESSGGEGGHVKHAADALAATIDMTRAALRSAVAIEWGHADELADPLAIKGA